MVDLCTFDLQSRVVNLLAQLFRRFGLSVLVSCFVGWTNMLLAYESQHWDMKKVGIRETVIVFSLLIKQ